MTETETETGIEKLQNNTATACQRREKWRRETRGSQPPIRPLRSSWVAWPCQGAPRHEAGELRWQCQWDPGQTFEVKQSRFVHNLAESRDSGGQPTHWSLAHVCGALHAGRVVGMAVASSPRLGLRLFNDCILVVVDSLPFPSRLSGPLPLDSSVRCLDLLSLLAVIAVGLCRRILSLGSHFSRFPGNFCPCMSHPRSR